MDAFRRVLTTIRPSRPWADGRLRPKAQDQLRISLTGLHHPGTHRKSRLELQVRIDFSAFGINKPILIVSHLYLAAFLWIVLRYDANDTLVESPVFSLGRVRRHLEHVYSIGRKTDRIRMTAFQSGSVQPLAHQRVVDLLII